MIYRCRTCQHEESRGYLPSVTCGFYPLFLLFLSAIYHIAAVPRYLRWVGAWPRSDEPVRGTWWGMLIAAVVAITLTLVGAVVLNFLLELVEYRAFVGRRCAVCGRRRWSWGYTQGFGV